jgi:hypothetical protein
MSVQPARATNSPLVSVYWFNSTVSINVTKNYIKLSFNLKRKDIFDDKSFYNVRYDNNIQL